MGFHKYEMFKFGYFSSREEDDIVSGIFVFTFEFLWLCTIHSDKFLKVKYLNSANYIVLFFVLKIAKCRVFDQKINQTQILYSDKF